MKYLLQKKTPCRKIRLLELLLRNSFERGKQPRFCLETRRNPIISSHLRSLFAMLFEYIHSYSNIFLIVLYICYLLNSSFMKLNWDWSQRSFFLPVLRYLATRIGTYLNTRHQITTTVTGWMISSYWVRLQVELQKKDQWSSFHQRKETWPQCSKRCLHIEVIPLTSQHFSIKLLMMSTIKSIK